MIDFNGVLYFFYYNGVLFGGGGYMWFVVIEKFIYNFDGSILKMSMMSGLL